VRCILRSVAGLECRCPSRRVRHQISGSLCALAAGAGDDQHAASVAGIVEDANDREGLSGVETAGSGDVITPLIFSWVNVTDKFALGLSIKRELEVENRIEDRRPGIGPRAAEKDEVLVRLKVLHAEVPCRFHQKAILARSHQRCQVRDDAAVEGRYLVSSEYLLHKTDLGR